MRANSIILGVALVGLAGCGLFGGPGKAPRQATPSDLGAGDAEAGAVIYQSYCAVCHGSEGRGDGPLAAELPVVPADLAALSLGNGGVFPAERAMTQIFGYPGKYHRGLMPEFGPMLDGPVVEWTTPSGETTLTPKALLDLVVYVESLQV